MILQTLDKYRDLGLLFLRVGIGTAFVVHGAPKMFGGPERWAGLGSMVGLPFETVFGFLAALGEFGGGICLVLGLLFRPALMLLVGTMLGAVIFHLGKGDGFSGYAHALESAILFFSLLFIGPGKYSLDAKLKGK